MTEKIPVAAVVGPTASGKTRLAVELAKALDGEVVSADSMQIYKEMDIGTAKPAVEEMDGVPHHLLDFLDPSCEFSVAQYVELARTAIEEIADRGKLPIVAGGTGLYVSSLLHNIAFSEVESAPELRASLQKLGEEKGNRYLWEQLQEVDPQLAAELHWNNVGRVIRALEVYRLTGVPMSEHKRLSRLQPSPYRCCVLGLNFRDRGELYRRIDKRVDLMLEQGLLEEIKRLLGRQSGKTARQAIGYKELIAYLEGECPLEQAVEKLKQDTRRYAKRQLTWFRREEMVHWLYAEDFENGEQLTLEAVRLVEEQLGCRKY